LVYNRKASAPWSAQREAGIESATVDSTIEVPQYLQPIVDTGIINKEGNWKGIVSSDETFRIDTTFESIANGAEILAPQKANREFIDMTGYNTIFLAINPTNAGAYALSAVMAPQQYPFANLTPVNSGQLLKGLINSDTTSSNNQNMNNLYVDTSESLVADVWNIFMIEGRLANQKVLQFKIANNSGDVSTIDFAYMRVV
jgi:hypothetical protein